MNNFEVVRTTRQAIFVALVCGTFLLILGVPPAIMYLTDKEFAAEVGVAFLITCLVLVSFGVWLFVVAGMYSYELKKFKKYVAVISKDPSGYIPNIAATLGTSENDVKSNLEIMIKKGYFYSAFIDENSNCIVFANIQTTQTAPTSTNVSAKVPKVPGVEMVTVKCSGCGGINTIVKGQTGECDYCGSAIMGDYWNKGTYSSNRVS